MISFPNAKINIGLNILGKRQDGYHDLQTIFYPIAIKDALEIIEAPEAASAVAFSSSGFAINGKESDNLCIKAYDLLRQDFPQLRPVKMHLHKIIPMGAGMGGGSADAAFTLQLLNEKFKLQLSRSELLHYALQLGSDCPFFILNEPCIATGRGEIMEPVSLDLSSYKLLVVQPGIHVSTAAAFSAIDPGKNNPDLKTLVSFPVAQWKDQVINDFEEPVFQQHPEIAALKNILYEKGALYASMSGSGSTVYGIFDTDHQKDIHFPAHYFYRWL